jgi:aminopeptidase N
VIDKWFAMQAAQRGAGAADARADPQPDGASRVQSEESEPRTLADLQLLRGNPAQFHAADGSGYAFWAEQVLALDAINPQVAARLARSLELWRRFTPTLRDRMREALEQVAAGAKSRDVREIVEKALANARDASPAAATKPRLVAAPAYRLHTGQARRGRRRRVASM